MNAVIVPVGSIATAKGRLSTCLTEEQREQLALAMLGDMLRAIKDAATVDLAVVVSSDQGFLSHASALGAEVFDEGEPRGLNEAVRLATLRLEELGVRRALIVPGDVPLISASEINVLFATDSLRFPVVLVPSLSGEGTNGLLLSPPSVLAPVFEGESRVAHFEACRRAGLRCLELGLEGFKLDIDTPQDLALLRSASGVETADLLASWAGLALPTERGAAGRPSSNAA